MENRLLRRYQGLLLVLMGLMLVLKISNHSIIFYIHERFIPLTILAAALLFWLARGLVFAPATSGSQAQAENSTTLEPVELHSEHAGGHTKPFSTLLLLLLPVVLGFLPAAPLTPEAVLQQGMVVSAYTVDAGTGPISLFSVPPENRSMLDWFRLVDEADDPSVFIGQPVSLIGTVVLQDDLPPGQFFLSRLLLTCCAADAYPVGILVDTGTASVPEEGLWIRVEGSMQMIETGTRQQPKIAAETVFMIDPPAQPYIYP